MHELRESGLLRLRQGDRGREPVLPGPGHVHGSVRRLLSDAATMKAAAAAGFAWRAAAADDGAAEHRAADHAAGDSAEPLPGGPTERAAHRAAGGRAGGRSAAAADRLPLSE